MCSAKILSVFIGENFRGTAGLDPTTFDMVKCNMSDSLSFYLVHFKNTIL